MRNNHDHNLPTPQLRNQHQLPQYEIARIIVPTTLQQPQLYNTYRGIVQWSQQSWSFGQINEYVIQDQELKCSVIARIFS